MADILDNYYKERGIPRGQYADRRRKGFESIEEQGESRQNAGRRLSLWQQPIHIKEMIAMDSSEKMFELADRLKALRDEKKEAEQFCESCHGPGKQKPLPVTHPPKYRCLFCHKRK